MTAQRDWTGWATTGWRYSADLSREADRNITWASLAQTHPNHPTPNGIDSECPTCHAQPGVMCTSKGGALLGGWASHAKRGSNV